MKRNRLFAAIVLSVMVVLGVIDIQPARSQTQTDDFPFQQYFPGVMRMVPPERLGPFGAKVTTVVIHPTNPDIAYAGTWGNGIYKSVDGGRTWFSSSKGLSNLMIQSLAISPSRPNALYAGVYYQENVPSGVYKSTDGGENWYQTGRMINYYEGQPVERPIIYTIAIHPWDSDVVYAGTRMGNLVPGQPIYGGGGVFKTTDGGVTWRPVNNGLPEDDLYIYDLAIDPSQPDRIFTAMHESGVYMTENGGSSWVCINSNIPHDPYEDVVSSGRSIVVNNQYPRRLYYGTYHRQGIFTTTNRGNSWFLGGLEGLKIVYLSIDSSNPNIVYATTNVDGVFITTDQGVDWDMIRSGGPGYTRVAVDPSDGSNLLVGTDQEGVFRSSDRGAYWASSYWGISGYPVNSIAIDPANPLIYYASVFGKGVYKSTNRGISWSPANNGLGDLNVTDLVIDNTSPSTVYATTTSGGVYKSTNGAVGWGQITAGFPTAASIGLFDTTSTLLPFAEREPYDLSEVLFVDGVTEVDTFGFAYTTGLAISPVNTGTLLAGTLGRGVLRYANGSWSTTSLSTGFVFNLLFDQTNPSIVFAAGEAGVGGILKSTDGGVTWAISNAGISGRSVYALAQSGSGNVYAGTDRGVFQSNNGGTTWRAYGLENEAITALFSPKRFPDTVFAGSGINAYVNRNGAGVWSLITPELSSVGVLEITEDPGALGMYTFATRLGGVYRVNVTP